MSGAAFSAAWLKLLLRKYPDATFLRHWTRAPDRTQPNPFTNTFHFEGIPGLETEFFPQSFGNDYSTRSVNSEAAIHVVRLYGSIH
jgi:hypothetical protein